jgi:hypothetical protein
VKELRYGAVVRAGSAGVLWPAENAVLRMTEWFWLHDSTYQGKIRREVMKKKSKVKIIKNGKKRGEWAELVFAARAVRQGLPLSKPW